MAERFYKLPRDLAARKDIPLAAKVVYAIIGDHIGKNGHAWPGVRRLGDMAGIGRNAVMRAVAKLEESGLLAVERRGNGQANHYRIIHESVPETGTVLDEKASLEGGRSDMQKRPHNDTGPKTGPVPKRDSTVPKTGTEAAPFRDPNQTDLRTRPNIPSADDAQFDAFWKAYPNKVGKKAARKAWDKAKDRPPVEDVILAVKAQAQTKKWTKDNGQYIPNPATWLNQGRWDDELPPEDTPPKRDYGTHKATPEEAEAIVRRIREARGIE